jgi:hypothetical protein
MKCQWKGDRSGTQERIAQVVAAASRAPRKWERGYADGGAILTGWAALNWVPFS